MNHFMARQRPTPGIGSVDPGGGRRRWSAQRDAHLRQVHAFSYLMPSRTKRSVTQTQAALRYAEHLPAGRTVRLLLLVAAPAYLALQLSQGTETTRAILFALALAALVFAASTFRLAVGNHGISFDIAGLRQVSSFGFVPLYAVREAQLGRPAADWPKAPLKGGWWPGRRRVSVLHVDEAGAPQAFQVWVSDPEAFGTAVLGRPLSEAD